MALGKSRKSLERSNDALQLNVTEQMVRDAPSPALWTLRKAIDDVLEGRMATSATEISNMQMVLERSNLSA